MAMSALSTSALSSLEAMLLSLMRGSGGGGGDVDAPLDDTLASPPPPPLPARPTARGRHPSRRRARPAAPPQTLSPPSPSSSSSLPKEQEDATSSTTDDVSLVVEELERKATEVEAQLRRKEEENAALKRRIESYHIRWLEYEIRIKSLEEAFHEQMATLQLARDAARRAEEATRDRRECSELQMNTSEEPPPVRLWHGRDRMLVQVARRSAVSRLGAEFRRQSHTLKRGAAALVGEAPPATGPWQPAAAAPSGGSSTDDLKRLKAQFRAWTKDYKARLRRAKAELGRDRRRRQGSCWI
ncbi:hypothetical protein SEVIR_1G078400v4 [Setaria viridis]|uniref:Uncharacterized protein n=1 Tax=Setaria viridis TaxID=4556 RepID=A0A4U6WAE5_SETVI|nr:myosin-2-like [Setaria viridis]TKW37889.1 hypothetical protein SEVIR_1G078400v2 [Setaria viridis]